MPRDPLTQSLIRFLVPETVKVFKGIDRFHVLTGVPPDHALDCLNVMISNSGGLEKLRLPTALYADEKLGAGPGWFFDYQQGNGLRQTVASFGSQLRFFTLAGLGSTLIQDDATNVGTWDGVESNNLLFMVNGKKAVKWNGTALQLTGIVAPGAAPTVLITSAATIAGPGVPGASRGGGIVTITTLAGSLTTIVGMKITITGVTDASFNTVAATILSVPSSSTFTFAQAGPNATSGNGQATPVGAQLTMLVGRKYKFSWGNSVTGHESNLSPASASSGPGTNAFMIVQSSGSTDPQVDTLFLYATLDGGADYFLDVSQTIGMNLNVISDPNTDLQLDQSQRGQLINNPPPQDALYLMKFQGRVWYAGMASAPQDIAYTGYERIFRGRPEESVPPNNRLRLSLGADPMRGMGPLPSGAVFFSQSNQMFMLRGVVEDITLQAPTSFSALLEELPWKVGCASHFSIAACPYGLVWLAADFTVQIFDGSNRPYLLSENIHPLLSTLTPGQQANARGCYFKFLDRDWYVLLVSLGGAQWLNKGFIFDLHPEAARNVGIFPFDLGRVDSIGVIENALGIRQLAIAQLGLINIFAASDTEGGITSKVTSTTGNLVGYWQSGYFGGSGENMKMFRFGRVLADQGGFSFKARLVDDVMSDFRSPEIVEIGEQVVKVPINRKAKRCSVEIQFPQIDVSANVLELGVSYMNLSER